MITLYHAGGAWDFQIISPSISESGLRTLIFNACKLLKSRGYNESAQALSSMNFEIWTATNEWQDVFSVLDTTLHLQEYESLRMEIQNNRTDKSVFTPIANALTELGTDIRFITCNLEMEKSPEDARSYKLSQGEILKLVNQYIGVEGGYLGDFNYRTHEEFYPQYCNLDIDPYKTEGTTRQRFISILENSEPNDQAKIVRGTLDKYQVGSAPQRTQELFNYFSLVAQSLENIFTIQIPDTVITSKTLRLALNDAETLLQTSGATSGVDRIHTALHSYLLAVCEQYGIQHDIDADITGLFKNIRAGHPAFVSMGPRADDIRKVLKACAVIMDALNPLRNRASMVHPNKELLEHAEAMLVINICRTLLHYLDTKFSLYQDT